MRFPRNETLTVQQVRRRQTDSWATASVMPCASPHTPRHPGRVPGSTGPRGRLFVGLADGSLLVRAIPSPARWTPEHVRGDGVSVAEVAA